MDLFSLPPWLEMRSSPEYGRGLYARKALSSGAQVITAHALTHVAANSGHSAANVCQHCLEKHEKLLRCGRCKFVHYCRRSCQQKDWKLHKVECAGMERVKTATPTSTMRLVIRLLTMATDTPTIQEAIDFLVSARSTATEEEEVRRGMMSQVEGVALLLGDKCPEKVRVATVLVKVMCNAFNILDSQQQSEVGMGVYGVPSLINHSCDPNCVVVFSGSTLHINTIKSVAPGEQLFISYCEILDTRERRNAHLFRVYSFHCSCHRCQTEESEGSPLYVMYSPRDRDVSEMEKTRAMSEGFSLVDNELKELERQADWTTFVRKCQDFTEGRGLVLHAMNVALTRVLEQQERGQLQLEEWENAVATGSLLTKTYRHCLSPSHPASVLHLVKMGKLRRVLGSTPQLQLAAKELKEALQLLPVSLGRGNPLLQEVEWMLLDTEQEMRQRTSETH